MNFSFATCAALFLLLTAASCAPAGLQNACMEVRESSLKLNQIAKAVSVEARNRSKDEISVNTSLVWMEAEDMCDPGTLRQKSVSCIEKILSVLESYQSEVEMVAGFKKCSAFASEVKPVMHKLHKDMSKCVKSKGGKHHEKEPHKSGDDVDHWEEGPLCYYTMERLFSFSIFTARVFAVGDPAHHTEGSVQKCT